MNTGVSPSYRDRLPRSNDPPPSPSQQRGLAAGCLLTLGSALVTCVMLFINGSLVMAVLVAIAPAGPPWFRNPKLTQFLLFSMPVLLVVLQWMMLDYLRSRLTSTTRMFRRTVQSSTSTTSESSPLTPKRRGSLPKSS